MNIEMSDNIWNKVLKGIKSGSGNATLELMLHEAVHEWLYPPSRLHFSPHPSSLSGRWEAAEATVAPRCSPFPDSFLIFEAYSFLLILLHLSASSWILRICGSFGLPYPRSRSAR